MPDGSASGMPLDQKMRDERDGDGRPAVSGRNVRIRYAANTRLREASM